MTLAFAGTRAGGAVLGVVLAAVVAAALPASSAAAESPARLFAAHALALWAAGVEGEGSARWTRQSSLQRARAWQGA